VSAFPLLLLVAALPGQFVDSPAFLKDRQQAALEATVRIVHPGSQQFGVGVGSGAIVHRDDKVVYVLTAEHLLPPGQVGNAVDLYFYTAKSYPEPSVKVLQAGILQRLPDVDLAVIRAVLPDHSGLLRICPEEKITKKLRWLPGSKQDPFPVLALGVGGKDDAPTIWLDHVHGLKAAKPGCAAYFYETGREPTAGRSGGPLVDEHGYLIGICNGKVGAKGYYLSVAEIRKALDQNSLSFLLGDKRPAK
jgi:hypothetical protein